MKIAIIGSGDWRIERQMRQCVGSEQDMKFEGINTDAAAYHLGQKYNIKIPIIEQAYNVLYNNVVPKRAVMVLMARGKKSKSRRKIMKKFVSLATIAAAYTVCCISVSVQAKDISVYIDGVELEFDQPPIIENERTLVPMRAIFEALGAEVDWEQSSQIASAVKNSTEIQIGIGNDYMTVNDENVFLDCPAMLVNERTLIPVRAISEAFGCNVEWDGNEQKVIITTPDLTEKSENSESIYTLSTPVSGDYSLSNEHTMNSDKTVCLSTNENKSKSVTYENVNIEVGEDDILGFWIWTSRETLRQYGDGDYTSKLQVSINGGNNIDLVSCYKSHGGYNIEKLDKGTFVGTINTLKFTFTPNSETEKEMFIDSVELNYKEPTYIIFNFDSDGDAFYNSGYSLFKSMGLTATFCYQAGANGKIVGFNNRTEAEVHQKMIDDGFDYGIYSAKGTALSGRPDDYYSDYLPWNKFAKEMFNTNSAAGIFGPSTVMSTNNKVGETYDKAMIDAGFMVVRYSTTDSYMDYFDTDYREFGTYSISGAWTADSPIVQTTKDRIDKAIEYGYSVSFMSHTIKTHTINVDNDTLNIGEQGLRTILEYAKEKQDAGECKIVTFAEYMRLKYPDIYNKWNEEREQRYNEFVGLDLPNDSDEG